MNGRQDGGHQGDRRRAAGWSGALIACLAWCNVAAGADPEQSVALVFDNDIFMRTDLLYTSGLHLDYVSGYLDHFADGPIARPIGDAAEALPLLGRKGDQRFIAYNLAQVIITPEDTHTATPPANDLPYAGFLLFTTTFIAQREHSLDALGVTFGMLGPHSYAGRSQNVVHRLIGNDEANGWSHQLHDEPILNVGYERRERLYRNSWNDLLVSANGAVGNFATEAGATAALRVGWHLPDDYWMPPPFAAEDAIGTRPWTRGGFNRPFVELSLSVNAEALGHIAAFDGNLFRASPHVDHQPWNASGGINLLASPGRVVFLASVNEIKLPYDPPDHRHWDRYGRIGVGWSF
jgi:hypothetical protein